MKFYREIIQKLKDGEPFKFSRWGDGEWLCMQGEIGENRDGNTYLPELGAALVKIVESEPDYYMGIQYGVFYNEKYVRGQQQPSLREYMIEKMFELPGINWVNGDVLHQASEFGYLKQFVDALNGRKVRYIGADYFRELPFIDEHLHISETNSFNHNDGFFIERYGMRPVGDDSVYLVSAAMNSNVIINGLHDNVTAIDIGSVFDPYLGRPRATYQHTMKIKPLW